MTKRITIQSGDYVLLSDIPNEQVFNLVKECFGNAGFNSVSSWSGKYNWDVFHAYGTANSCFANIQHEYNKRQLSLSDVFNSVNGWFEWEGKGVIFTGKTHSPVTVYNLSYSAPDTYKISKCFDVNNLQHMSIESVVGRATGKSTAHYLELISKAMKSPEQWVKVTNDDNSTMWGTILAGNEIKHLCEKLGLDWMEFDNNNQRIRYMPYQTVKLVTKWEVIA